MKWAKKIPTYNETRNEQLIQEGWIPLKEPKRLSTTILLSFPLMILISVLLFLTIDSFIGISLSDFGIALTESGFKFNINILYVIGILLVVIVHEILHLIFIPKFIKSSNTYIGITYFGGFVYTEKLLKKGRFIIITVAPLVIISIFIPIILGVLGLMNGFITILVIINGAGASVDILLLIFIITQVSNDALIINNGNKTYWKK